MWPTLVSLGPINIHSFGVLLFLGLFMGSFKLWRRAKEEGWDETAVLDTWLTAGIFSLLAARLGFIFFHQDLFSGSWYKMLFVTKFPGLSAEFAWLGAALSLTAIALIRRLSGWLFLEAAAPALVAVEIFVWLGNWLAGSGGARTQLLGVAGSAAVYLAINYLEKSYRSFGWAKPGFIVAVYLLLSGAVRLALKFWWWGGLTILGGGLIFLLRSGITLRVPRFKRAIKRRHFDYV